MRNLILLFLLSLPLYADQTVTVDLTAPTKYARRQWCLSGLRNEQFVTGDNGSSVGRDYVIVGSGECQATNFYGWFGENLFYPIRVMEDQVLLNFNTTSIPAHAEIISASLTLYVASYTQSSGGSLYGTVAPHPSQTGITAVQFDSLGGVAFNGYLPNGTAPATINIQLIKTDIKKAAWTSYRLNWAGNDGWLLYTVGTSGNDIPKLTVTYRIRSANLMIAHE